MTAWLKRFVAAAALMVGLSGPASAQSTWPPIYNPYDKSTMALDPVRSGCVRNELDDVKWAHLHQGMTECETVTLSVHVAKWNEVVDPASLTGVQVQWTVKGVPVSGWLNAPFTFQLRYDNPNLPAVDGVFDVSVKVQGADNMKMTPLVAFVHLYRGRALATDTPIIGRDLQYSDEGAQQGPGALYVPINSIHPKVYPVDPAVTPWHVEPYNADLYQEQMANHTELFFGRPIVHEEPAGSPSAGLPFVRMVQPKFGEDHRYIRDGEHQDRLPFMDGGRGTAFTTTYVGGQFDLQGNFWFVESGGGSLRVMAPDGTVTTKIGWVVDPAKHPVWWMKDLCLVRANEIFKGTMVNGRYTEPTCAPDGFRTPMDVTIDPQNPNVKYVAEYEGNAIWKVDCSGVSGCVASVFAGDVNHQAGFSDGQGTAARLHGPVSLVWSPVDDKLYVADQDNDAIRVITRNGQVSTLFGSPGQDARQVARGVTTGDRYTIQAANRTAADCHYSGVRNGCTLETYLPQMLRLFSNGDLALLDIGFGAIRRINPTTLEATHLNDVTQRFTQNNEALAERGWAFLDVDRWGNTGPLDGIYYGVFQADYCSGDTNRRFNEVYCWMPKTGGPAHTIFQDWDPNPEGWGTKDHTDPPHYPWIAAVDPRGAVILGGGGEHGLTRLRLRKPTDFMFPNDNALYDYGNAKFTWQHGCGGSDANGQPWVSPMVRNGYDAHGLLIDATDYVNATDAQIVTAFGLDKTSCDAGNIANMVKYVRANAWTVGNSQPPVDQDCVGVWSAWSYTPWTVDPGGLTESRTGTRTFTVTTPPSGNGQPCPQSPETTTETRPVQQPPTDPITHQMILDALSNHDGAMVTRLGAMQAAILAALQPPPTFDCTVYTAVTNGTNGKKRLHCEYTDFGRTFPVGTVIKVIK